MKIKFGILGAAGIARKALIPASLRSRNAEVVAIASGSGKAKAFAAEFNIPKVFDSYEALLEDPKIDAVYIPLPNHVHKKWTLLAAKAGKHVLCEKPAALTSEDAVEMAEACKKHGVVFMEAFMYQFHPQHERVQAIINSGEIGDVKFIQSAFTFPLDPTSANIRLNKEAGGGALFDVGCYCVHASRMITGEEPILVEGAAHFHPELKVDMNATGILQFPNGVIASFNSSFEQSPRNVYEIYGTKGSIKLPFAFRPDQQEEGGLIIVENAEGIVTEERVAGDQYTLQVEHFADCVVTGREPIYSGEDTVKNMRVIEALLSKIKQ